jgi:hypothetical protein
MNDTSLHDNFVKILKHRIPEHSLLANKLTEILYIGKEAVYRRLRGEVPFTFSEVSIIAKNMGISLDQLIGTVSERNRPFTFKITRFAYPEEIDYKMAEEYLNLLRTVKNEDSDTEICIAAKMIPDPFHLKYKNITRFYFFKWLYQYDNIEGIKKFHEVSSTDKMLEMLNESMKLYDYIKNAYYIFDKKMFQCFVDDVKYFEKIGLILRQDIEELKTDLFSFLDYLENLAIKGVNEAGNKVKIYISNVNFETGYCYINSERYKLNMVRIFTLYDIYSLDYYSLDTASKWMQSLRRGSILISESGEMQRLTFFKKQREIVDSL